VSLAVEQNQVAFLTVTSSAFLPLASPYDSVIALIFLGVAGIGAAASLFGPRLAVSVSSWIVAIILGLCTVYQPIAGSFAMRAISFAALLIGAGLVLDRLNRKWAIAAASIAASAGVLASGLVYGPLAPDQAYFGPQRQAPALVVAAAEVDEGIRTLRIDVNDNQVDAELLWGAGRSLEQTSLAYQLLLPASPIASELAQLSGSLVAGNPTGVRDLLSSLGIDFVLLEGEHQESISAARAAIDSMTMLQAAGQTPYGHLWQVVGSASNIPSSLESPSNRNLQLVILAGFLLLAIPTPASIRGAKRLVKQK
jgi:energy-converting hydrogenase Eha subunit A